MALPINLEAIPATIASGQSLSGSIGLGAKTLVGIAMPAAWDAASLTFQVSVDGGTTWLDLSDATGAAVTAVVAASKYVQLDPAIWAGINNIKVRSGTSGSPVAQNADRILSLMVRPV